jgi:cyclopropane fatty-acyl-phospholipid synthase-like methyltransferase
MNPTIWNKIFKNEGKVFVEPHEAMPQITSLLPEPPSTILDLGCGSGRHVLYLAQQGFTVFGLDSAPAGVELTQQALQTAGLSAYLDLHDLYTE